MPHESAVFRLHTNAHVTPWTASKSAVIGQLSRLRPPHQQHPINKALHRSPLRCAMQLSGAACMAHSEHVAFQANVIPPLQKDLRCLQLHAKYERKMKRRPRYLPSAPLGTFQFCCNRVRDPAMAVTRQLPTGHPHQTHSHSISHGLLLFPALPTTMAISVALVTPSPFSLDSSFANNSPSSPSPGVLQGGAR